MDLLHAGVLAPESARWSRRLRIVIGYAGHVSDVFRIPKGIDVCHRGSWGLGSYPKKNGKGVEVRTPRGLVNWGAELGYALEMGPNGRTFLGPNHVLHLIYVDKLLEFFVQSIYLLGYCIGIFHLQV
jgi:hypothetical protein